MPTLVLILLALVGVGVISAILRATFGYGNAAKKTQRNDWNNRRRLQGNQLRDQMNPAKTLSPLNPLNPASPSNMIRRHREMLNHHQENLRRIQRYRP